MRISNWNYKPFGLQGLNKKIQRFKRLDTLAANTICPANVGLMLGKRLLTQFILVFWFDH